VYTASANVSGVSARRVGRVRRATYVSAIDDVLLTDTATTGRVCADRAGMVVTARSVGLPLLLLCSVA